jgi:hypothetical protein
MPMPHPATPESFSHFRAMQESTHYLTINQLEDGCAYLIHARNSYIGIWRASDSAFVILREKLGRLFLFPEFHWDTGEPFGTAKPFVKISGPVGHTREALDELHARISYADYMSRCH